MHSIHNSVQFATAASRDVVEIINPTSLSPAIAKTSFIAFASPKLRLKKVDLYALAKANELGKLCVTISRREEILK